MGKGGRERGRGNHLLWNRGLVGACGPRYLGVGVQEVHVLVHVVKANVE